MFLGSGPGVWVQGLGCRVQAFRGEAFRVLGFRVFRVCRVGCLPYSNP